VEITPLDGGATSIEDFYSYANPCAASANTPLDLEISETSQLFLYDGPAGLSLVAIHDRPETCLGEVPATGGRVNFTYSGLPGGAAKVVGDDPSEGNIPNASWAWVACCTDGNAVRGGLDECAFDVTIEPEFIAGIETWIARSGPSGDSIVTFPSLAEPVTISCNNVCPESPIAPSLVDAVVFPGGSHVVEKCVETPEIPPKPDIYFMADTTGSMFDVIAAAQADAGAVLAAIDAATADPRYGAGDYKDFPFDPYAFNNAAPIPGADDDGAAALAAIGAWTAGGGADGPEGQLFALDRLADAGNPAAFRPDASKIVVWFGDAPAHDPVCAAISGLGSDITEATATAALVAADIKVVAISTLTGFPAGLDDDPTLAGGDYLAACGAENGAPGQASRISAATGGVHLTGVAPADIADAILDAIGSVSVEVEMVSNCADPISVSFEPASQAVTSGGLANFVETISVAADAPGGTYICVDNVLIDGELLLDPATGAPVEEVKVIRVPEGFLTGGGQINNGKGRNVERISFGGNVGFMEDASLVGQWQTNFHNVLGTPLTGAHFHSTEILSLQFFNDGGDGPAPPPANANVGVFVATGRVGQEEGFTLIVCLADRGEPGRNNDSLRLQLFAPSGGLLYDSFFDFASQDDSVGGACADRHKLDAGNFQIHSGVKG
jgi:hypothetical protein